MGANVESVKGNSCVRSAARGNENRLRQKVAVIRPYVPAGAIGFLSILGVGYFRATLPPDTGLYLHGGSWLYPSPMGRFLGTIGGYQGMAFLTALSATFLPYLIGKLAEQNGRDRVAASWYVLLFPAAWYLFAVSVDAIAALFLVISIVVSDRKLSLLSLTIAALLHLALLPAVVLIAALKHLRGLALFFFFMLAACVSFAYMVATPYGLLVSNHVNFSHFVTRGFLTFFVGIAPFLIAKLTRKNLHMDSLIFFGLSIAAIGGLEAAMQQHFQPRYCMVGALILAAGIAPLTRSEYVYDENGARFSRQTARGFNNPQAQERG